MYLNLIELGLVQINRKMTYCFTDLTVNDLITLICAKIGQFALRPFEKLVNIYCPFFCQIFSSWGFYVCSWLCRSRRIAMLGQQSVAKNVHLALIHSKYLLVSTYLPSQGAGWYWTVRSGLSSGLRGTCMCWQIGGWGLFGGEGSWGVAHVPFLSFKGLGLGTIDFEAGVVEMSTTLFQQCMYWKYDKLFGLKDMILSF